MDLDTPNLDDDAAPAPDHGGGGADAGRRTLLLGVALVVVVLVGAIGAVVVSRGGPTQAEDCPPQRFDCRVPATQRDPLPDAELAGFAGGEPVATSTLRGRPHVVNFWASWCAPCVEEMPALSQVAAEARDDVAFLGIDVNDVEADAKAFVDALGVSYPLVSDPRGDFYAAVRAFGMPTTLFVDAEGMIVYRHTGAVDAEQLRSLIGEHLGVIV